MTQVRCQNCDWIGEEKDLPNRFPAIQDMDERINPGEEVPAGECPECAALCHVICEHQFGPVAPEIGDDPVTWEWCIRCGMLKLGNQTFTPGIHQRMSFVADQEYDCPPGAAACPICGSVYLDSDHAATCCEDKRRTDDGD